MSDRGSSYYGVLFPEFWTGRTGRELRQLGGKDAQVLGVYLTSNRHANMIGLYRVDLEDVRHETGLKLPEIARGLAATATAGFGVYDQVSAFVWVRQMARFRLGLRNGDALEPSDKRVIAVNKIYHAIDGNPFLGEFFDANAATLRLKTRRPSAGLVVPVTVDPITRGRQGASKALRSQVQIQSTGTGDQDQEQSQQQDQHKAAERPLVGHDRGTPTENAGVIQALASDVLTRYPGVRDRGELEQLAKQLCARRHVAYDSATVGQALERALAHRRRVEGGDSSGVSA